MLLLGLCVEYIASHLGAFPHDALESLPVELRSAVLGHLLHRMKLEEVDFSALMGKEGQTPVIDVLDLSASPYEETRHGPSAQLLKHIGACAPHLKELRLKNCRVLDDALVKVMVEALPHLEALYLSGAMGISDKAILYVRDKMGSQLKHLKLNTPNKLTSPALNQLLISTPNLRSLSVNSAAALTDAIIGVVADDCKELVTLDIENSTNLTDKTLEYIANGTDGQGGLGRLKSLTLSCNRLTGAHLDTLVASCNQLETLSLPNASFKDPGNVIAISKLASLRQLHIYSSWCLITREVLQALLQGCPLLEALSLCLSTSSGDAFETFKAVPNGLSELVVAAYAEPFAMRGSTITFGDAKNIIEGCPRLQKLNIHNAEVEVLPLALQGLPQLCNLFLGFVGDAMDEEENGDECTEEKAALVARKSILEEHVLGSLRIASSSLRKLRLSDLPTKEVLTPEAMANIAKSSPKLEVLKIAQARIDTDSVLGALSAARPALRKVQLYQCDNATDQGIVTLTKSCGHKITGLDLRKLPHIGDASLEAVFRNCGQLRSLFTSQHSRIAFTTVARVTREHPHVNVYHF